METVTSTETCEFDELWSMDPTSVKLKGAYCTFQVGCQANR